MTKEEKILYESFNNQEQEDNCPNCDFPIQPSKPVIDDEPSSVDNESYDLGGWSKPEAGKFENGSWYVGWQQDLDFIILNESDLKVLKQIILKAKKKEKNKEHGE